MKRGLGCLALVAIAACSFAQSAPPVGLDGFVQRRSSFAVVSTKVGELTHVAKKYSVEIDALAGYNITEARASVGFAAVAPITIADQLQFRVGLGDMLDSKNKFSTKGVGLYFGFRLSWK